MCLIPALAVSVYYIVLASVAISVGKKSNYTSEIDATHTFAIVIPAYNEEELIQEVLHSHKNLKYPKDKYQIFVVADNCSDNTVEIARNCGVACFERFDQQNLGKGFALGWAFDRIIPKGYDAIIVIDADCKLDEDALLAFDYYLQNGNQVLQSNFRTLNTDENAMTYAISLGNLIENKFFYSPKSYLGLSVFLQGTGMVFRRSVLELHPWRAYSIGEDFEFTLNLLRSGIQVKFVDEVHVLTKAPSNRNQLSVQRTRWAQGTLGLGKTHALKLIFEGLVKRRLILIDAGWSLLILSRPIVLLEFIISLFLGGLSILLIPGTISVCLFLVGLIIMLTYIVYFGIGITFLGISLRRLALLIKIPSVVLRLLIISLLGMLGLNKNFWARTPRT